VYFHYPDGPNVINGISLLIKDGSFVAILGKNGAGKTTLVKCINGLVKPISGDVIVNGINTKDVSVAEMAKKVGLVFQNADNQLFASSVWDELDFSLKNIGLVDYERKKRIESTLKELNLYKIREKSPFLLSGGEKKRTALASLMCMDQDILIADEPTQGQDHLQRENIKNILKKLHDKGKTVIIITHDLNFILEVADRVIVIENGQVLLDGTVQQIFTTRKTLKLAGLVPTIEIELKWFLQKSLPGEKNLLNLNENELLELITKSLQVND
ncbi:MAG: energy-coupling factor ABC transporter ATP-binding protein, partial [Promethearchaeota archaeon]